MESEVKEIEMTKEELVNYINSIPEEKDFSIYVSFSENEGHRVTSN